MYVATEAECSSDTWIRVARGGLHLGGQSSVGSCSRRAASVARAPARRPFPRAQGGKGYLMLLEQES